MSTITWDRINNDVENIINEFNNFLDNNQYNEANEIIEDIMSAFDGNFGIELNNAPDANNKIYDNKVHEVYSKIKDALEARASGQGKTLEELLKTIKEQTGSAIVQKNEERYSFVEITN